MMSELKTETEAIPAITPETIKELKAAYLAAKAAHQAADEAASPIHERWSSECDEALDVIGSRYRNEFAEIFAQEAETLAAKVAAETTLREALTAWGEQDEKNKTFDEHLQCRHTPKYVYANNDAVEWAERNAPVLIRRTVDKKCFEAMIPSVQPEFVTITRTVTPVIKEAK